MLPSQQGNKSRKPERTKARNEQRPATDEYFRVFFAISRFRAFVIARCVQDSYKALAMR